MSSIKTFLIAIKKVGSVRRNPIRNGSGNLKYSTWDVLQLNSQYREHILSLPRGRGWQIGAIYLDGALIVFTL
jgi:hypothetical protein